MGCDSNRIHFNNLPPPPNPNMPHEIAYSIGVLTMWISVIEISLAAILGQLLGDHTLGLNIFYSHSNRPKQLEILEDAINRKANEADKREMIDVVKRFGEACKKRNQYVHQPWMTNLDGDILLAGKRMMSKPESVSVETLKRLIVELRDIQTILHQHTVNLLRRKPVAMSIEHG